MALKLQFQTLSLPIEAQIRLQFNFPLQPVQKITVMQNVSEVIHPVLWIEMVNEKSVKINN